MCAIMDDFIIRALIGGLLVALLTAPLGCLVVWQRMAYFGAALSHAALLGIALGFLLQLDLKLAILMVSVVMTGLMLLLLRIRTIGSDTILGILAHGSLAFGLLAISLLPTLRVDLMGYLFGDILTISWNDIAWIAAGGTVIVLGLLRIWRPLLSTIVHPDLATADGHSHDRLQLVFLLLLSVVVAVSMQVVGLLLIVSLLIIPAAAARGFSRSPEQMVAYSFVAAAASVICGLMLSLTLDTPAGPSIVASACLLFAGGLLLGRIVPRRVPL